MALTSSLPSVDPRPTVRRLQVSSAGLTTGSGGYSPGDQLGNEFQFANAARITSGFSTITTATIVDEANVIGAVDLHLFSRSVSNAGNGSAVNFSDADMQYYVGTISFPAPISMVNNAAVSLSAIGLTYQTDASTLYGYLVSLSSHSFFNATSNIRLSLVTYQY